MDLLHHSIYHSRLQLRRCGRGEGWAHSCYHGNICSGKSVSTEGLSSGEQLVGNALGTNTDFHLRTIWNGNWTLVSYHTIAQGLRRLTMLLLLYFVGLTQHNLSVPLTTAPSHTPSHTSITHCSSFMVLLHAHHAPPSQPNTDNIWESEVGSNTSNLRSQETGIIEAGGHFTSPHPSFEDAARLPLPTATPTPVALLLFA